MRKGYSYIKNEDFINKPRNRRKTSDNAILNTTDAVSLYPRITYNVGTRVLKEALEKQKY